MINRLRNNFELFSSFTSTFNSFLNVRDESLLEWMPSRDNRGRLSQLRASELLCALSYHSLRGKGRLSSNLKRVIGVSMSDASLSYNRHQLSLDLLDKVSECSLGVLSEHSDRDSYYAGHVLVGLDGTFFNLRNTDDILAQTKKLKHRRSADEPLQERAFSLLPAVCMVELGLHNPLAVKVGALQESELSLAHKLLEQLPQKFMLLGDRLYGNGFFADALLEQCELKEGAFLLRVNENTQCEHIQQCLSDGSSLIDLPVRSRKRRASILKTIRLRQIRLRVKTREGLWVNYRFWTNLLDAKKHPAKQLCKVYLMRWEHELYFNELKTELKCGTLLKSNTLHHAVQEVILGVWSTAIIARLRHQTGQRAQLPPLRISFAKTLDKVKSVWDFVEIVGQAIEQPLIKIAFEKIFQEIIEEASPPRAQRSCPRKIRQNSINKPKLRQNLYFKNKTIVQVIKE